MKVAVKTVVTLVKTLKDPKNSAVYADNFFTSLALAEYLLSKFGYRYIGTTRENRIGYPPFDQGKGHGK